MYLLETTVENIKCFRRATVNFVEAGSGERIRRWTVLLGENGLGKSTLLQAMAIPLAGPNALRELLPRAPGWARLGCPYGEVSATLVWTEGDAQLPRWPKKTPYHVRFAVTGGDVEALPDALRPEGTDSVADWPGGPTVPARERETFSKEMNRLRQTAYAEQKGGWLSCGYGPFRRLFGGSQEADQILYAERRASQFVTLFREDAALSSTAQWLVQLYNLGRDGDASAYQALEVVKETIARNFLMKPAELIVDARSASLDLEGRGAVPLPALSDGYRAMLALGLDLLRRLLNAFPQSPEPHKERGVVLIDELDAHLHPNWQRQIGTWLLERFPNLQFVIATHSPYLSQVPGAQNVLLKPSDDHVRATAQNEDLVDWTVEQVLTELLGLESLHSTVFEERLSRFLRLRREAHKKELSAEDEAEFNQLRLWSEGLQSGNGGLPTLAGALAHRALTPTKTS